jgi:hypothetical protein
MNNCLIHFRLMFALAALLLSVACDSPSNCTKKVVDERDVFTYFTAAEKRTEPSIGEAKALKHPGKIFLADDFIFLTEEKEGLHIIDNRDPKNPKQLKFISIEGNWDIAIKGNILYADSYADLLVFDVKNPANPRFIRRVDEVFNWDNVIGRFKEAGLEKEMVKEVKHIRQEYLIACDEEVDIKNKNAEGQAGSMTRFSVSGNFMYTVDNLDLYIFNIQVAENPILADKLRVDDKIETIFSYDKRLFIGGLQGVYIYDKTNPLKLKRLEHFKHIESCDPVIVDNDYAFATMRKESSCRQGKNALMVLDVKDFNNAKLVAEYPMQHPYGLDVKDKRLYIADGEFGLKVYGLDDMMKIDSSLLAKDTSFHSFDLIAHYYKPLLVMIGKDGLFQFDISNPDSLIRLGAIKAFGN